MDEQDELERKDMEVDGARDDEGISEEEDDDSDVGTDEDDDDFFEPSDEDMSTIMQLESELESNPNLYDTHVQVNAGVGACEVVFNLSCLSFR